MKIIIDQNIPLANPLFGDLGSLVPLPGRKITVDDCRDADILLVRSVTQVSEHLLKESTVRFVGTCTIGTDHLDIDYLNQRGITWANAPGCNAWAVVQYVLSAMAILQADWREKTIGIIGCGNIGGRLYRSLKKLGVACYCYDPLLSSDKQEDLVDFATVLSADIITCHTPLTQSGQFPSYHLLGAAELAALCPNTVLINSSRGPVIDNSALLVELDKRPLKVALDVWENEPHINEALLRKVALATPHIAGYSLEGKERGSWMIYQALCDFLSIPISENKLTLLNHEQSLLSVEGPAQLDSVQLNQLLLASYDIRIDDGHLRQFDCYGDNRLGEHFDDLRKTYPSRREYSHFILPEGISSQVKNDFQILIP